MEAQVTGYVVAEREYKDNDFFLDVLTDKGIERILARGIKKIKSKNRVACQLFTLGEYHYTSKSEDSLKILTTATIKKSNINIYSDLNLISQLSLIGEIIAKNFSKENFYDEFSDLINYNSFLDLCWLIKEMIIRDGFLPEVSKCYSCNNQVITAFSFDGGFVCAKCMKEYDHVLGSETLRLISYLFRVNKESKYQLRDYDYNFKIASLLLSYYFYHQPLNLKSYEFFLKVQND